MIDNQAESSGGYVQDDTAGSPSDYASLDNDELCPECEMGRVVEVGPMCWQTGHTPLGCSKSCGWSA